MFSGRTEQSYCHFIPTHAQSECTYCFLKKIYVCARCPGSLHLTVRLDSLFRPGWPGATVALHCPALTPGLPPEWRGGLEAGQGASSPRGWKLVAAQEVNDCGLSLTCSSYRGDRWSSRPLLGGLTHLGE